MYIPTWVIMIPVVIFLSPFALSFALSLIEGVEEIGLGEIVGLLAVCGIVKLFVL